MSWSPQQQAMLEAMGYTVWRSAGAPSPDEVGIAADPRREERARVDAGMPAAGTGDDPLLRALRRAAGGRDPSPLLPPLERLRGDAQAKRALWPRLRALRRR